MATQNPSSSPDFRNLSPEHPGNINTVRIKSPRVGPLPEQFASLKKRIDALGRQDLLSAAALGLADAVPQIIENPDTPDSEKVRKLNELEEELIDTEKISSLRQRVDTLIEQGHLGTRPDLVDATNELVQDFKAHGIKKPEIAKALRVIEKEISSIEEDSTSQNTTTQVPASVLFSNTPLGVSNNPLGTFTLKTKPSTPVSYNFNTEEVFKAAQKISVDGINRAPRMPRKEREQELLLRREKLNEKLQDFNAIVENNKQQVSVTDELRPKVDDFVAELDEQEAAIRKYIVEELGEQNPAEPLDKVIEKIESDILQYEESSSRFQKTIVEKVRNRDNFEKGLGDLWDRVDAVTSAGIPTTQEIEDLRNDIAELIKGYEIMLRDEALEEIDTQIKIVESENDMEEKLTRLQGLVEALEHKEAITKQEQEKAAAEKEAITKQLEEEAKAKEKAYIPILRELAGGLSARAQEVKNKGAELRAKTNDPLVTDVIDSYNTTLTQLHAALILDGEQDDLDRFKDKLDDYETYINDTRAVIDNDAKSTEALLKANITDGWPKFNIYEVMGKSSLPGGKGRKVMIFKDENDVETTLKNYAGWNDAKLKFEKIFNDFSKFFLEDRKAKLLKNHELVAFKNEIIKGIKDKSITPEQRLEKLNLDLEEFGYWMDRVQETWKESTKKETEQKPLLKTFEELEKKFAELAPKQALIESVYEKGDIDERNLNNQFALVKGKGVEIRERITKKEPLTQEVIDAYKSSLDELVKLLAPVITTHASNERNNEAKQKEFIKNFDDYTKKFNGINEIAEDLYTKLYSIETEDVIERLADEVLEQKEKLDAAKKERKVTQTEVNKYIKTITTFEAVVKDAEKRFIMIHGENAARKTPLRGRTVGGSTVEDVRLRKAARLQKREEERKPLEERAQRKDLLKEYLEKHYNALKQNPQGWFNEYETRDWIKKPASSFEEKSVVTDLLSEERRIEVRDNLINELGATSDPVEQVLIQEKITYLNTKIKTLADLTPEELEIKLVEDANRQGRAALAAAQALDPRTAVKRARLSLDPSMAPSLTEDNKRRILEARNTGGNVDASGAPIPVTVQLGVDPGVYGMADGMVSQPGTTYSLLEQRPAAPQGPTVAMRAIEKLRQSKFIQFANNNKIPMVALFVLLGLGKLAFGEERKEMGLTQPTFGAYEANNPQDYKDFLEGDAAKKFANDIETMSPDAILKKYAPSVISTPLEPSILSLEKNQLNNPYAIMYSSNIPELTDNVRRDLSSIIDNTTKSQVAATNDLDLKRRDTEYVLRRLGFKRHDGVYVSLKDETYSSYLTKVRALIELAKKNKIS